MAMHCLLYKHWAFYLSLQLQFHHVPLYLEWAPVGVFVAAKPEPGKDHQTFISSTIFFKFDILKQEGVQMNNQNIYNSSLNKY